MKQLFGNAVIGQSGGPTSAINATLAGVIRGVSSGKSRGQIRTLYGMRNGMEGLEKGHLFNLSDYFRSEELLRLLEQTPAAALGTCRKKLPHFRDDPDYYRGILNILKQYDIRFFFYIGGNDSMDTVMKMSEFASECDYDMQIIGIPKTIDNDLTGTDHTPGYGSSAKYIAVTTQEIIRDCAVYDTKAVTVLEIMGRDAGWLTGASGLGKAVTGFSPDAIYLPERPFSLASFYSDIEKSFEKHPNVVISVSEGIRFADGKYVSAGLQSGNTDAFGHPVIAGAGRVLADAIREQFGCKTRSVELNLPQRCASHLASGNDLTESVCIGKYAVEMVADGKSGRMVVIKRKFNYPYQIEITDEDIRLIANRVRQMDDKFIVPEGNDITPAFCDYALPLIEGEVNLIYEYGMPKQLILPKENESK